MDQKDQSSAPAVAEVPINQGVQHINSHKLIDGRGFFAIYFTLVLYSSFLRITLLPTCWTPVMRLCTTKIEQEKYPHFKQFLIGRISITILTWEKPI